MPGAWPEPPKYRSVAAAQPASANSRARLLSTRPLDPAITRTPATGSVSGKNRVPSGSRSHVSSFTQEARRAHRTRSIARARAAIEASAIKRVAGA